VTVLAEKTWVRRSSALIAIKVVHTVIWAFFVSCIFAIQLAEPGAPKKRHREESPTTRPQYQIVRKTLRGTEV
jgi:hypothetical protein